MSRTAILLVIVLLAATPAAASDFGALATVLWGLYATMAVVVGGGVWFCLRRIQSTVIFAVAWGTFVSLLLIPTYTTGGNGDGYAPPLFNFLFVAIGGDPAYAYQSVGPFLWRSVVAIGLFALYRRLADRRARMEAVEARPRE